MSNNFTQQEIFTIARDAAKTSGVPEDLFIRLVTQDPQFSTRVPESIGINRNSTGESIYGAAKHLSDLAKHFNDNKPAQPNSPSWRMAAAAFNSSKEDVDKAISDSHRSPFGNIAEELIASAKHPQFPFGGASIGQRTSTDHGDWTTKLPASTQDFLSKVSSPDTTTGSESPSILGRKAEQAIQAQRSTTTNNQNYQDFSQFPDSKNFYTTDSDGAKSFDSIAYKDAIDAHKAYQESRSADRSYNLGPLSQYVDDIVTQMKDEISAGNLNLNKANSLFDARMKSFSTAMSAFEGDAFKYGAPAGAGYVPGRAPGDYFTRGNGITGGPGLRSLPAQTANHIDPFAFALQGYRDAEQNIGNVQVPQPTDIASLRAQLYSQFGGGSEGNSAPPSSPPPPPDTQQAPQTSMRPDPKELFQQALDRARELSLRHSNEKVYY